MEALIRVSLIKFKFFFLFSTLFLYILKFSLPNASLSRCLLGNTCRSEKIGLSSKLKKLLDAIGPKVEEVFLKYSSYFCNSRNYYHRINCNNFFISMNFLQFITQKLRKYLLSEAVSERDGWNWMLSSRRGKKGKLSF